MSKTKLTLVTVTVYLLISNFCFADWRDNAKVKMLGAGESHSLFLTSDDKIWGFGLNGAGDYQLGIGISGNQATPVEIMDNIMHFDGGWFHSVAVDVNGFAWAWGRNRHLT